MGFFLLATHIYLLVFVNIPSSRAEKPKFFQVYMGGRGKGKLRVQSYSVSGLWKVD
jgi:hypothetical protein